MEFDHNDRLDFSYRPSIAIVQHTNHNIFKKKIDDHNNNNNNKNKNINN